MGFRSRVMEIPWVYEKLQHGLSRPNAQSWLVSEVIHPQSHHHILDVGCGNAVILRDLGVARYVGIDHNSGCIAKAQRDFGSKGEFHNIDLTAQNVTKLGKFDSVLLLGVLHHLSDRDITQLLINVSNVLNPGGNLVTFDCAIEDGQHPAARLLARLDRGRYARSGLGYRKLIEQSFSVQQEIIRHDLLRVPYTHVIFRAQARSD